MAQISFYRTYRFIDKDPIIDALRTVVKGEEHLKNSQVHAVSGVATATLDNWFDGTTRRPQNGTVCAVTSALGYGRRDELDARGQLRIGFVKLQKKDWKEEAVKQADWLLSHPRPKRKKTNGANGHKK